MNIKEQALKEIRTDKDIIKDLTIKLNITPEQVKDLLIRYAFNKLVLINDATTNDEVADILKYKYLESKNE